MRDDMSLALNQFTVRDLHFDEAARLSRAAGFDGLGVLRASVDELGVDHVSMQLKRHALTPTSVCVAMGLTHADPEARRDLLRQAVAALDAATELGAPLVVVVGGPARDLPLAAALAQVGQGVADLAHRAEAIGGRILIEPLHPVLIRFSALTGLRQTLDLIGGLPACGVVADTWHLWSDPGIADAITAAGDTIGIVHLADWSAGEGSDESSAMDRELPGEGIADIAGLCRQFASAGFAGWWEVEVLSERLWRGDQRVLPQRCAAAARRVLHGLSAAVASARHDAALVLRCDLSRGGDRHVEASAQG